MSGPLGFPLAGFGKSKSFLTFLNAKFAANLQLVLDPGDLDCVPSSSEQTVTDLKGAADLWRGSDGTVESIDPAFIGTPGGFSDEYWECVRANVDRLTFKSNPTVLKDFVKNGNQASFVAMTWPNDTSANHGIIDARNLGSVPGYLVRLTLLNRFDVRGNNGNTTVQFSGTSSNNFVAGAWNFVAWSHDESGGAGASFINLNGTVVTFNGNAGTASLDPGKILELGRDTFGATANDGRIGPLAAWDRNLSQTEIEDIRKFLIERYVP